VEEMLTRKDMIFVCYVYMLCISPLKGLNNYDEMNLLIEH